MVREAMRLPKVSPYHAWLGFMGLFALFGAACLGASWQSRVDKADFNRLRGELFDIQDELNICDRCCLQEIREKKP
jgi:hypothetical protein